MEQHLTASEATRQFLTFALGAEEYGVEIPKIQEIKGYAAPHRPRPGGGEAGHPA
jgi:purine-binding chemotaxis protein CheW